MSARLIALLAVLSLPASVAAQATPTEESPTASPAAGGSAAPVETGTTTATPGAESVPAPAGTPDGGEARGQSRAGATEGNDTGQTNGAEAESATTTGAAADADAAPLPAPEPPEMPAPPSPPIDLPAAPVAMGEDGVAREENEILLSDWDSDDWLLVKPRISLVDLDGYFRLRGDILRSLDFRNESTGWATQSGLQDETENPPIRRAADFTTANIRLRLEPTINVTSNIHITTTVDILDNLVLGSTPNTLPPAEGQTPINLLSTGQLAPSDGVNAVMDSIVVKRAYARITALNEQLELRFGRMPNHWGLGMMTNSGDCLDCDSGDVSDRVQLSFKAADHVFTGMFDMAGSGPIYRRFGEATGQAIDAVDWDDIDQFSLRVQRVDHPDDVKDAVAAGDWVLNYGLWGSWRIQYRDLGAAYYLEEVPQPDGSTTSQWSYDPDRELDYTQGYEERRDANVVTIDAFGKFYWGPFKAALEAAFIWGELRDLAIAPSGDSAQNKTELLQWGAALELSYKLPAEYAGVEILLNGGVASGDSAPGFGVLSERGDQRGVFGPAGTVDRTLSNFQFSPNYHIDLLMYRTILGAVTDSFYVSPGASYDFDENINIRGHVTYTNALFKRSTPSCYDETGARCRTNQTEPGAREMGLEVDAEVSYGLFANPDGNAFRASIRGGILFPFGAFSNPDLVDTNGSPIGPQFAWTIQSRLYITF